MEAFLPLSDLARTEELLFSASVLGNTSPCGIPSGCSQDMTTQVKDNFVSQKMQRGVKL